LNFAALITATPVPTLVTTNVETTAASLATTGKRVIASKFQQSINRRWLARNSNTNSPSEYNKWATWLLNLVPLLATL
jgi:hypothetical protein